MAGGFSSSGSMDRFPTSDYTVHGERRGSSCPAGQQIIRSRRAPGTTLSQNAYLVTCATPVPRVAAPVIQPAPIFKPIVNVSVPTQVTTETQVSPVISPIIDSAGAGFTAATTQETDGANMAPAGAGNTSGNDSNIFLEMLRLQAEKDTRAYNENVARNRAIQENREAEAKQRADRDRIDAENQAKIMYGMEERLKQFVIDSTKNATIDPATPAIQPAVFPPIITRQEPHPQTQQKPPLNWALIASAGLGAIGLILLSQRI